MANIRYEIPENESAQAMAAEAAPSYGITIPVTVPNMGGYSFEDLTQELTDFAMQLIRTNKKVSHRKAYSSKLQRLRSMSVNHITTDDVSKDERLAYLINK